MKEEYSSAVFSNGLTKEFWNSLILCKERAKTGVSGEFFKNTAFLYKKRTVLIERPLEIFRNIFYRI